MGFFGASGSFSPGWEAWAQMCNSQHIIFFWLSFSISTWFIIALCWLNYSCFSCPCRSSTLLSQFDKKPSTVVTFRCRDSLTCTTRRCCRKLANNWILVWISLVGIFLLWLEGFQVSRIRPETCGCTCECTSNVSDSWAHLKLTN